VFVLARSHALRFGFVGTLVVVLMMAMVGAYAMLDATTRTSSTTGQFSPVKPPPPAPGEIVVSSPGTDSKTEPSTDRSGTETSVSSGERSGDGGSSSGHSRVRGNDVNRPSQITVLDGGEDSSGTDTSSDGSSSDTGSDSTSGEDD
jgi:hypothetical protein